MGHFLTEGKRKGISKCENCPIMKKYKKGKFSFIERVPYDYTINEGSKDVLIILPRYIGSKHINKFIRLLELNNINNYKIVFANACSFNPANEAHNLESLLYCNNIHFDKYNYKVIVTVGSAISLFMQKNKAFSWKSFSETQFNQTYFYTEFKDLKNKQYRVYPFPHYDNFVLQNGFERDFVDFQCNEILDFIQSDSDVNFPSYNIHEIEDPNQFLKEHMDEKEVAWDVETNSLDHHSKKFNVICVTMTFDGINGYYLPFDKINKRLLSKFFLNKYQITATGKFDCKAMSIMGVSNTKVDEDINLLYHLFNTEREYNSLSMLSWLIGFGGYDKELEDYIQKYRIKSYAKIPKRILLPYSVLDTIVTYRLYKLAQEFYIPKQPDIYKLYKEYIITVLPVYKEMEMTGMDVNFVYLNRLNNDLIIKTDELSKQIKQILNKDIDLNSQEQLSRALEEYGLPCYGVGKKYYTVKDKDGNDEIHYYYTTDDKTLKLWKKNGHKIAEYLLEYRQKTKLRTSFVGEYIENEDDDTFFKKVKFDDTIKNKDEGIVKFLRDDKKLHPNYLPAITKSWRSASNKPNAQQFPKQENKGKLFRPLITCPDDYLFGEVDYSGFQLRIACLYSKDDTMLEIFKTHGDMHSVTAINVFCRNMSLEEFMKVKKEEPYKTYRFKSKGVGFGFLFGRSAYGFKPDLEENWTDEEIKKYIEDNNIKIDNDDLYLVVAEDIRNKFFETYKKLPVWINNQHNLAMKYGYVDSSFNGRRHLSLLHNINIDNIDRIENDGYRNKYKKKINNLFNIAVNSPVQNFEALTAYRDMRKIWDEMKKRNLKSRFIAMIHDSFSFYIHKDEIADMYHICTEAMNDYDSYEIPILCEFEIGKNWLDMKEVTKDNLWEFK